VAHRGRARICVRRDGFIKGSPTNDWQGVFDEFSDQLGRQIGKTRDLVLADFSTTGAVERAVFEIVLMDAMHKYFDYAMQTLCGIPRITLLGTVEDWKSVGHRAEHLAEFGLERWISALTPILDQFAAAAAGYVDPVFWRSFYKRGDPGSGGPFVSGWIN